MISGDQNVSFQRGQSIKELEPKWGAKKSSRLYLSVDGVIVAKGIQITESSGKAKLINKIGAIWRNFRNKTIDRAFPQQIRTKYIPLIIEESGKEKLIYANVNSIMKHLYFARGQNREELLRQFSKDDQLQAIVFKEGIAAKLSPGAESSISVEKTDKPVEVEKPGETIRFFLEVIALRRLAVDKRLPTVMGFFNKPWPGGPLVYKSDYVFTMMRSKDESYKQLSILRMGLSTTALSGETIGSVEKIKKSEITAKDNWARTDEIIGIASQTDKGKPGKPIIIDFIKQIHTNLCKDLSNNGGIPGAFRGPGIDVGVEGGRSFLGGEHVEKQMKDYLEWLNKSIQNYEKTGTGNPVLIAAQALSRIVSIHPFMDGNGRTSRMVMDYVLQRLGLPPAAMQNPAVAVFGDDGPNVSEGEIVKLVKEGIARSAQILKIPSPFSSEA